MADKTPKTKLYLLCDIGTKTGKGLYVTNDELKAKHWQELLVDQGVDSTIVELNSEIVDDIDAFKV